jgi:hypothetical protein
VTVHSDNLPKGVPVLSHRQENWANLYVLLNPTKTTAPHSQPRYCQSAWTGWVQTANPSQVTSLMKQMSSSLLPKEKVQWIDPKNQRLLLGVERIFAKFAAQVTPAHAEAPMPYCKYFDLDYESRYDNIMLNLDIWDTDLAQKEGLIARARKLLTDQQLDHAKTKWLDRENHTQLEWALNYLKEHQEFLPNATLPSTPDEKFAYILGTLDQPGQHPLERKVFLDSMRRAWSQYKYRYTGKSQRQVYFSLSREARSKLEDAAEHQNRRKSDIVEELILQKL